MIYIIILALIILFSVFCYYENNKLDLTEYNIIGENAEKSFKIVHLSDFHS